MYVGLVRDTPPCYAYHKRKHTYNMDYGSTTIHGVTPPCYDSGQLSGPVYIHDSITQCKELGRWERLSEEIS